MAYTPVNAVLWLDLPVLDLDRANNFYEQVLQLQSRDGRPNAPTVSLQFASHGSGITLILTDKLQSGTATPYLNCNGRLNDGLAKVKLNGGKILIPREPMEPFGYRAVIQDSEGNRVALHSAE